MTGYNRGDVILVSFVFADETGIKRRPALVISSGAYHSGRDEAIIAAITSRTDRVLTGDHIIHSWESAGLLFPSMVTGVIRTINQDMIYRKLGSMPVPDMAEIDSELKMIMGI